ncbi:MAG: DUF2807 domain-containing protein [Chitinophagales bacterium]|nr:DUF2807 domain-containing protein [Chitinophagales bacterium]
MKKYVTIIAVGILAVCTTSCHKRALRGEGPTVSETRYVGEFSKIEANGSTHIEVVHDDVYSIIVTGYSNLVPVFETKLKGDRLILQFKDFYWNVRNDNITVEVHTPYLDKTSMNGSGNIAVGSGFEQDNFNADINGSGDISVKGNSYKSLYAKINGSGGFSSEYSEADRVEVNISGSGSAYVKANDYLKVRISGSGDVYYRGNPSTLDTDISGSGKVHKRN